MTDVLLASTHSQWDSFFAATVGAAAALAGLIFVAVSINIDRILSFPWLPSRTAGTIAVLLSALTVGALALVPDQSLRQLGVEVLVVSGAVWSLLIRFRTDARRQPGYRDTVTPWLHLLFDQLGSLPAVIAAILLLADQSAGLGMLAFAILAAFVVAVANAWVLLVEVRR